MPVIHTQPFREPALLCNSTYVSAEDYFSTTYLRPREFTTFGHTTGNEDVNWKSLTPGGYGGPTFSYVGGESPTGYDRLIGGGGPSLLQFDGSSGKSIFQWYWRSCGTPVNLASLTRGYLNGSSHCPRFVVRRWIDGGVASSDPNAGTGAWDTVLDTSSVSPNPATFSLSSTEGYFWWMSIINFQGSSIDLNGPVFKINIQ